MFAHLRPNLPLYGVGLVLAALFALAVVLGQNRPSGVGGRAAGAAVSGTALGTAPLPPELAALPATAQDDAVVVSQLAPDDARVQNAAVSFAASNLPPAPPFAFRGSEADFARARECLALAGLAEAGSGDADQRAVMQVILNRARHPAFANTVCGVVFQGSERRTGCQFTFTCDGSLARRYPDSLWRAARERAEQMLRGAVYQPVGNATHYHTDWVYPWWSPKLDKIAQVNTHLFFRWRGHFGTTRAWTQRYGGGEPDPAALRGRANAVERTDLVLAPVTETLTEGIGLIEEEPAAPAGAGVHFLSVEAGDRPADLVRQAALLCAGELACQVYGWSKGEPRPALPLSPDARRLLRFSYVPGRAGAADTVFYDCMLIPGAPPGTCLPQAKPVRGGLAAPGTSAPRPSPTPSPEASATPSRLPSGGTLKEQPGAGGLIAR